MAKFDIRIKNEVGTIRLPLKFLTQKVSGMLRRLGWKKAGLSILFVGDRRIRAFNRRYLGHDRPTDVIAFSQLEGMKPPGEIPWVGDIVISLTTTRRQAVEYGNSFIYELCFYICHGLLHIMGYRDNTKKEARRMERKQKSILKKIGLTPSIRI
ncbi:MAG TPA: rRNA maturation RNase YbeY [bacterium]|nr:rRNA maturation RNase YbeY [bacterium]